MDRNYAAIACTAVRQYGEGQKGFFDLPVGEQVTLSMGYRVYADANQTKARMYHDYTGITFPLLGAGTGRVVPTAGADYLTAASASILSAIALTLAF